ncbi:hypothetical protein QO259_03005 [Salinicola sp. JS01]|uniref:hypothetical protein n=1 Tax=Salinicola sp. JS01 TaxID=3050071 RepID=UPI00255B5D6D|nr:hypothetical protein [Salinicola sp. JS01]WIX33639.1 hypothetical protein QO259_03005 [Salinicola sp. JS01]
MRILLAQDRRIGQRYLHAVEEADPGVIGLGLIDGHLLLGLFVLGDGRAVAVVVLVAALLRDRVLLEQFGRALVVALGLGQPCLRRLLCRLAGIELLARDIQTALVLALGQLEASLLVVEACLLGTDAGGQCCQLALVRPAVERGHGSAALQGIALGQMEVGDPAIEAAADGDLICHHPCVLHADMGQAMGDRQPQPDQPQQQEQREQRQLEAPRQARGASGGIGGHGVGSSSV